MDGVNFSSTLQWPYLAPMARSSWERFPKKSLMGLSLVRAIRKKLQPPRFDDGETAECMATPGVSFGLVWTSFGGDVQFVEATSMVGKGDLHLTGQPGDVIKESAQIALTWVRARAADLKFSAAGDINLLENQHIHIHFPAGAVPKDGPSTGVTLVTSLVSLFSQRRVRADTAMTGDYYRAYII